MGYYKNLSIRTRSVRHSQTAYFFDRRAVRQAMDKTTHKAMEKGAARIRQRARRSMRYVTDPAARKRASAKGRAVSSPGQPPRAVKPHPFVREYLFYFYDPRAQQAVIGPAGFGRSSGAPHTLEFGGRVRIRNRRRLKRTLGGGGEVRVGGPGCRTTKPAVDQMERTVQVTYARLVSQEMVDRADRLNEELYGPRFVMRTMAARPYMGPALAAETPALSALWASSVRG